MIKLRFSYVPGNGVILSVLMMAAHPDPTNPWDGSQMFGRKIEGICFVDKDGNVLSVIEEPDLESLCRSQKSGHLEVDLPDVKTMRQTAFNMEEKKADIGKAGICLINHYGYPGNWTYLAIREDIARFEVRKRYLNGAVDPANDNLLRNAAFCAEVAECYTGLFNYTFYMQTASLIGDLLPLQMEFAALFEQGLKKISTLQEYQTLCKQGEDIIRRMEEIKTEWVAKSDSYKKTRK